jgi:hypothetical protein
MRSSILVDGQVTVILSQVAMSDNISSQMYGEIYGEVQIVVFITVREFCVII